MGDLPLLKRLNERLTAHAPKAPVTDLAMWKRRRKAQEAGKLGLRRPPRSPQPPGPAA